jgi:hypothetical protein
MKKACIFLLLICFGCRYKVPVAAPIHIMLTDSNHSLKVKGLDYAVIEDINRDTVNNRWQSLIPVYRMPADTDMKDFQNTQPGNYQVKDSTVVFTPDTPFKKGQVYFVRYYQHSGNEDPLHYIRDKKRTGALRYKDLIFSY